MLQFHYVARQRSGQQVEGTIAAASVEEATRLIRGQSLFPVRVTKSESISLLPKRGKKVRARTLAKFYSQLSDLLRSGVPLLRSLDILRRQSTNPKLTEVLADIHKRVADGETMSDALGAHEAVFGELCISMVKAGQEGGFLEDVFKRISVFTERQEDLKARVVGALAYPAVLSAIGTLVIGVLLVYFVPQFGPIFDQLRDRGELPAATETLLVFSETIQSYGIFLLIGAAGAVLLAKKQIATPAGKRWLDSWKLRIPVAGMVFRDLAITRFNRVLGTLRRNGVAILQALTIAKDSTGNVLMKEAIENAAQNVQAGDKLATPLRASGCFPAEIVEMIEVAEESNNLENVLLESADSLEAQTTRQLDLAVRLLEPLMLLVMAAITLCVVIALLLPIIKMSKTIG